MKKIVIQFFDNNEQFDTFCDSNTTPMLLAQFIQEAEYYQNFNLSEIFYFKIKDTEYYFGQRNTPICKYISNNDQPTLIFYRGLTGQQNLKSCTDIESSRNQINNLQVHQQKDIQNEKEFSNTLKQNYFEQSSQAKPQQPKSNKIIITEIPSKDHPVVTVVPVVQNKNKNSQSLRLNEINYLNQIKQFHDQHSNSVMLQKVNEKSYNNFDISNQFSATVKSEIYGFDQHHNINLRQQLQMSSFQQNNQLFNNQQMSSIIKSGLIQQNQKFTKSQQKGHNLISAQQPKAIFNLVKNSNIKSKQLI